MRTSCRESELEALLAGELPAAEASRVEAHATGCADCARTLAWLKLERGWMAQRARRTPSRPALRFEALEARLRPAPARRLRDEGHLRLALGTAAAVLIGVFGLMQRPARSPSLSEDSWAEELISVTQGWSEGLISVAQVEVCTDPSLEAMARLEARVGACLVASPASSLRP